MDKPRRDEKKGLIAKNYKPINDIRDRPRVWCGDEAVEAHLNSQRKTRCGDAKREKPEQG